MFDARRLLDQFIGAQSLPEQRATTPPGATMGVGGFTGGALAGGLMGLLLGSKTGRKFGKSAATYGGMALLGGLAYKAYNDWQAARQPGAQTTATGTAGFGDAPLAMPPPDSRFLPPADDAEKANELGRALIRAMIAAAKADGHIDTEEQRRIFAHINTLELGPEEKAFVVDELARPLDLDAVVRGATSKETAIELYAASLLAMDPDNPAERGYLAMLAGRLELEPDLVEQVHAKVQSLAEQEPPIPA